MSTCPNCNSTIQEGSVRCPLGHRVGETARTTPRPSSPRSWLLLPVVVVAVLIVCGVGAMLFLRSDTTPTASVARAEPTPALPAALATPQPTATPIPQPTSDLVAEPRTAIQRLIPPDAIPLSLPYELMDADAVTSDMADCGVDTILSRLTSDWAWARWGDWEIGGAGTERGSHIVMVLDVPAEDALAALADRYDGCTSVYTTGDPGGVIVTFTDTYTVVDGPPIDEPHLYIQHHADMTVTGARPGVVPDASPSDGGPFLYFALDGALHRVGDRYIDMLR